MEKEYDLKKSDELLEELIELEEKTDEQSSKRRSEIIREIKKL